MRNTNTNHEYECECECARQIEDACRRSNTDASPHALQATSMATSTAAATLVIPASRGRSSREDGSGGGTKRKRPKFIASETFDGQRKGYIFKNGKSGVGYYRDQHKKDAAEATDQPAQPQESAGPAAAPLQRGRFYIIYYYIL